MFKFPGRFRLVLPASLTGRIVLGFAMLASLVFCLTLSAAVVHLEQRDILKASHDRDESAHLRQQALQSTTLANLLLERYLTTGSELLPPVINGNMAAASAALDEDLAAEALQDNNEEELVNLEQAHEQWLTFAATVRTVIALRQAGDDRTARATLEGASRSFAALGAGLTASAETELAEAGALESRAERLNTLAFWLLVAAGAVGTSLALVIITSVAWSVIGPLSRLRNSANRIANGHLDERAPVAGPQEVAHLGASVNLMAASLIEAIDQQRQTNAELRAKNEQQKIAENAAGIGMFDLDVSLGTVTVSPQFLRILGIETDDAVLTVDQVTSRIHEEDQPRLQQEFAAAIKAREPLTSEFRVTWPDQSVHWLSFRATFTFNDLGEPIRGLGAMVDITASREAERALLHRALHDPLTGLANRTLIEQRVTEAISLAGEGSRVAVLFVDLDHFKRINDIMGHAKGDQLLRQFAKQLEGLVRPGDTVGRLGGDEFLLILPGRSKTSEVITIAERILAVARKPRKFGGREFHVSASVGIASYPDDGKDAETLLSNADTAMYRAKELDKDGYVLFSEDLNLGLQEQVAIESSLRQAFKDNKFQLHYQPQVDLASGSVVGVEALIRMHDPERGLVMPDEFIHVAERSGLINPLGEWVLRTACAQAAIWARPGGRPLQMAVNVSPRQFRQPRLTRVIERVLKETGLPGSSLVLEITEGTIMQDLDFAVSALTGLKALGVQVAMDDFGIGYSSLSHLRSLPIDFVKIDKVFIQGIGKNRADADITVAIIAMAHSLGLSTIAEGVETDEQFDFLRRHSCDQVQGFLFSAAQAPDAIWAQLSQMGYAPRLALAS